MQKTLHPDGFSLSALCSCILTASPFLSNVLVHGIPSASQNPAGPHLVVLPNVKEKDKGTDASNVD